MSHDELENLKQSLISKQNELRENERKQIELTKESNEIYAEIFELRDKIIKIHRRKEEELTDD